MKKFLGRGEAFPSHELLGMCHWMGSHFHDSTDYNGVAFSGIFNRVTRMGCTVFRIWGQENSGKNRFINRKVVTVLATLL